MFLLVHNLRVDYRYGSLNTRVCDTTAENNSFRAIFYLQFYIIVRFICFILL